MKVPRGPILAPVYGVIFEICIWKSTAMVVDSHLSPEFVSELPPKNERKPDRATETTLYPPFTVNGPEGLHDSCN